MAGQAGSPSRRIVGCTAVIFVVLAAVLLQLSPSTSLDTPPQRDRKAFERARRAVAAADARHGANSLESARAIDALLAASPGDVTDLEPLARQALQTKESLLGRDHPDVARTLHETASWLMRAGRHQEALPVAERALAMQLAGSGPSHLDTLRTMLTLADGCRVTGHVGRALRLYERAMRLITRARGPAHPMLAVPLHYAGTLRAGIGDLDEARSLLERSLAIRTRSNGRRDNLAVTTLNALGNVRFEEGDLEGALAAFSEAEAGWQDNPDVPAHYVARAVTNQGLVRLRQKRFDDARRLLREALAIRERELGPRHSTVARARIHLANLAAAMGETARAEVEILDSLADQIDELGGDHPELMNGLASLARMQLLEGRPGEAIATALRCERIWQALARRAAPEVPGKESDPLDTAMAALASGGGAAAQAALVWQESVRSRGLRRGRLLEGDLIGRMQEALPAGTALLSLVRYTGPSGSPDRGEDQWLALVLDRESGPRAIPLPGASRVDAAVMAWYREASQDPRAGLQSEDERRYSRRARELAEIIWLPVQGALGDASQVWVVAEDPLRRVNLAALTEDGDGFILEKGPAVHALESEITLLSPPRTGQGHGILALGGPDFGRGDCGPGPAFAPLPGARAEVLALQGLWGGEPALSLTGGQARESAFHLLAPGRRLLHIASHAFTMGTPRADAPRDLGLTGLALSGANSACWERSDDDDGLLTGREIARMDLSGVEWAVLSGCETGLGPGGLGSAFQEAGVRRVISTLWPLEDGAARSWMRYFYSQDLKTVSAALAVQAASRATLKEQRRRGDTTHPFFWGGFVSSGDDR